MTTPPGYGPPPPGWGYRPPMPPPRRRPDWVLPAVLGGGTAVLMLALLVTCAATAGSNTTSHPRVSALAASSPVATPGTPAAGGVFGSLEHPEDVELLNCTRSAGLGWAGVDVKVTNRSSKPSTYTIKVAYASPDGTVSYGEGWVDVETLAPGQVTTRSAFPGQDVPTGAPLACTLTSARRTAA